MDKFEELLSECLGSLKRFVNFKIKNSFDAEDIIQEVCISAYRKYDSLKNDEAFKAWIISIARNKCTDYYRKNLSQTDIPLDEEIMSAGLFGINDRSAVSDTIDRLSDKDREIINMYYFDDLSHETISHSLGIPVGTVKSRLHYAKRNFKELYPYHSESNSKGETTMKKLPEIMPEYKIEKTNLDPFAVKCEEIMGWGIVPKLGEKISWALYDFPERRRTESCYMQVVGKAEVHGIEGVELLATEHDPIECNNAGGQSKVERTLVAQLTDTHCRILAESHMQNGVRKYYTFLDGDAFLKNWGYGDDNCGNEINLVSKGDIIREGNVITTKEKDFLLDVVGRYSVEICGKTYDTVCLIDAFTYNSGVLMEQFVDKNGRTVLERRFNRNDWAFDRYGKLWEEILPENERLTVNGTTFVHWYDCITDYIL